MTLKKLQSVQRNAGVTGDVAVVNQQNSSKPIDFDALVSGLLKVDPKQLPTKPGKKKAAAKKAVKPAGKRAGKKQRPQ